MPELPEVETIKRVIEPQIKGAAITSVTINYPELIAYPEADDFCKAIAGQTISGMICRGKFPGIKFDSGDKIIFHLRMTGWVKVTPVDYPQEKHTHVTFHLNNGTELRYSDQRRFGKFWLIKNGEEDTYSGIGKLGLEPFDANLTGKYLQEWLGWRRKTIKECLLEQTVVAGIGNIYSDEILFNAKIQPTRLSSSLTMEEWERLAAAIPERMEYFIEKNKVTAEEYLKMGAHESRNTPFLQVYGHGYEPCPCCGSMLCRTVIGSRSSVFCSVCQK